MSKGGWTWGISVVVLAIFTILYAYRGGETLWFLLILTGAIVLQGLLLYWLGPRHIQASRSWKPYYPRAGEPLEMELVLVISGGVLPLSMSFRDNWTMSGSKESGDSVILIGAGEIQNKRGLWSNRGQRLSCTYQLQPSLRGHYKAEELVVIWSDPFGWFKRKVRVAVNDPGLLVVHPAPLPLSWTSEALTRGVPESRTFSNRFLPVPVEEMDGLRGYLPGDSLKWIDWKHSAKRGELLARVSREPLVENHYLLLDTNRQSYHLAKTGKDGRQASARSFEAAIGVATAILHRELSYPEREVSLEGKLARSFWFVNDSLTHQSRAVEKGQLEGEAGLISGLNTLAGLSLSAGECTMASMLRSLSARSKGYRLTLITGSCTEEVAEVLRLAVSRGGWFEVLLTVEPLAGSEEGARIEQLRNIGINVAVVPGYGVYSQPSRANLSSHKAAVQGGVGHDIA